MAHRAQYFAAGGGGIAAKAPGTASTGEAYAPGGTTGPQLGVPPEAGGADAGGTRGGGALPGDGTEGPPEA